MQRSDKSFSLWVSLWHVTPFGAMTTVYERWEYTRIKRENVSTTKITLKCVLSSRLLVFLLMSPILSRLGHGFSWRWAFIMVWSEMKGTPNINMALLLAYSDVSLGSEREKSQVKKGTVSCLSIWGVLFSVECDFEVRSPCGFPGGRGSFFVVCSFWESCELTYRENQETRTCKIGRGESNNFHSPTSLETPSLLHRSEGFRWR